MEPRQRNKSISEKKSILERWQESSLSMNAYCVQEGISISSLKYWIRQFNIGRKHIIKKSPFIALEVPSSAGLSREGVFAEVVLVGGTRLVIHQQVPAGYLKDLLNGSL